LVPVPAVSLTVCRPALSSTGPVDPPLPRLGALASGLPPTYAVSSIKRLNLPASVYGNKTLVTVSLGFLALVKVQVRVSPSASVTLAVALAGPVTSGAVVLELLVPTPRDVMEQLRSVRTQSDGIVSVT